MISARSSISSSCMRRRFRHRPAPRCSPRTQIWCSSSFAKVPTMLRWRRQRPRCRRSLRYRSDWSSIGRPRAQAFRIGGASREPWRAENRADTVPCKLKPLLIAICASIAAVSACHAANCVALSHAVPAERIAALSRGFNADGWLNGPQSTKPADTLLRELRKAGMTHVRLPVPAERLMRRFASDGERDDLLAELGAAVEKLGSLGYSISIDLHPGDRFNRLHRDDQAAAMQELKNAWRGLAGLIGKF